MASPGPSPKRHKSRSPANTEASTTASNGGDSLQQNAFTFDTLLHLLYGKKDNRAIDLAKLQKKRQAEKSRTYCHVCRVDRPPNGCPFHEPSTSETADHNDLSYAIKSFPPEVQLCTSSIPGAHFGVSAKRVIPEGTWIGPYEGKRVKPEDLAQNLDHSYIWEIYENGQASRYIDGSDEGSSSWMRFIRCARYKDEQNLYAFQYLGNVFYRSYKDIPKGTEMLVWYDEKYPQYMGIPTGLQEIEFVNVSDIEKNPNAEQNRKSPAEQLKQSTADEIKGSEKERLQDSHKPRQHGYHGYQKASSVPARPRSLPSDHPPITSGHPPIISHRSTISFHRSIEEPSRGSQRAIMEAPLPSNYAHPTRPLAGSSLTYTPAGAYRKEFNPVPHAPVNISAGVPSQNVMSRVPTGGHSGITGVHIPEVHQKVMDEGPVNVSKYGSLMMPNHHGNSGITSENENWMPTREVTAPVNTIQTHPARHGLPVLPAAQPYPRHSNQVMKSSYSPLEPTVASKVTTAVTTGNNITTTSQEVIETSIPRRTSSQIVTEEALRERGYPVSTSPLRPRSRRRAPRMGEYLWDQGDDIFEALSEDEGQRFEEAGKATESNSNSSSPSSQPKDDNSGASIDEISMWRCRQCQKTFTQRVMLQVHVCPHEPFKPYRCGQCELSFDTAPELRSHVDTHSSEKPFKCGFCSRSFAGATTLNNHIRTHMGKRPFNCECGKSFAQAGQLSRHQRTPGECETMTAVKSVS